MRRLAALVFLSSLALTGCGVRTMIDAKPSTSSGSQTFRAHGISFQFPGDWVAFQVASPSPGETQRSEDVVGLDDLNNVTVTSIPLPEQTPGFSAWSEAVKSQFTQAFDAASGISVQSGPDEVILAGQHGLRWQISEPSGVGYVLQSVVVVFFQDRTEYFVRCQHTPERAREIGRGCEQVLGSFRLG